jgi:hypothetical protein
MFLINKIHKNLYFSPPNIFGVDYDFNVKFRKFSELIFIFAA